MAKGARNTAAFTLLAVAGVVVTASCGNSPNVACATTDVPLVRDVAAATRAVELAAATIGMADVPTRTEQGRVQEGARDFSLARGGGDWVLTQVSRSELVDFVDVRPAVAALEAQGFEQEGTPDGGMSTYVLTRGDQRASVSLGPRLRGNGGKVAARVQVDTGCRPA